MSSSNVQDSVDWRAAYDDTKSRFNPCRSDGLGFGQCSGNPIEGPEVDSDVIAELLAVVDLQARLVKIDRAPMDYKASAYASTVSFRESYKPHCHRRNTKRLLHLLLRFMNESPYSTTSS